MHQYLILLFIFTYILFADFKLLDNLMSNTSNCVQAETVRSMVRRLVGSRAAEFLIVVDKDLLSSGKDLFKVTVKCVYLVCIWVVEYQAGFQDTAGYSSCVLYELIEIFLILWTEQSWQSQQPHILHPCHLEI